MTLEAVVAAVVVVEVVAVASVCMVELKKINNQFR